MSYTSIFGDTVKTSGVSTIVNTEAAKKNNSAISAQLAHPILLSQKADENKSLYPASMINESSLVQSTNFSKGSFITKELDSEILDTFNEIGLDLDISKDMGIDLERGTMKVPATFTENKTAIMSVLQLKKDELSKMEGSGLVGFPGAGAGSMIFISVANADNKEADAEGKKMPSNFALVYQSAAWPADYMVFGGKRAESANEELRGNGDVIKQEIGEETQRQINPSDSDLGHYAEKYGVHMYTSHAVQTNVEKGSPGNNESGDKKVEVKHAKMEFATMVTEVQVYDTSELKALVDKMNQNIETAQSLLSSLGGFREVAGKTKRNEGLSQDQAVKIKEKLESVNNAVSIGEFVSNVVKGGKENYSALETLLNQIKEGKQVEPKLLNEGFKQLTDFTEPGKFNLVGLDDLVNASEKVAKGEKTEKINYLQANGLPSDSDAGFKPHWREAQTLTQMANFNRDKNSAATSE